MAVIRKAYNEEFAQLFEQPSRHAFRDFMKSHHGETRQCDFKGEWPEMPAIAKQLLGMGNMGGGCLVIGVAENQDKTLTSVGLPTLKDKADVANGIKNYLPSKLLASVDVVDFKFDESEYPVLVGKRFQLVFVDGDPTHIPHLAMRSGTGIREAAIYARGEGLTEEATHDQLQEMINRRLATGHSTQSEMDLAAHLQQLKFLYSQIQPSHITSSIFGAAFEPIIQAIQEAHIKTTPNSNYPKEDFDAFIARMIEVKKRRIERELDCP
jgi:hypothetical protein